MIRRFAARFAFVSAAACWLGCGPAEAPRASGKAMAPRPAVQSANRAPVVERVTLLPSAPRAGELLRASVEASDPDGDPLLLEYRWELRGRPLAGDGPTVTLPVLHKDDSIRVTVVASDGQAKSEPASTEVQVGNLAPRMLQLAIRTQKSPTAGEEWVVEPEAEDPDGDRLSFRYEWLVNGVEIGRDRPTFSKKDLSRGDRIQIRVTANDGESDSAPLESAALTIGNSPPDIVSSPPPLDPSGVFRYRIEATDPDGDRNLLYQLGEAPEGMVIDARSGELVWSPTRDQGGRHKVEVVVDDRRGGRASQIFHVSVVVSQPGATAEPGPASTP